MVDETNATGQDGQDEDGTADHASEMVVLERRQVQPRRRSDVEVRQRAGLPAPVKRAAVAVAVGAAMQIGLGIAGKYIASQAGKKAAKGLLTQGGRERRPATEESPWSEAGAMSETLIIRRVWIRRER